MYNRHIEVAKGLVFITESSGINMDVSLLPNNVAFYVETEDDWWIERNPFEGREKNEDVRHIALKLLAEAEQIFAKQEALAQEEFKQVLG